MSEDPFARFERSRGGWLIPVAIFLLGAVPTVLAIRTIDGMALMQQLNDENDRNVAAERNANAADDEIEPDLIPREDGDE